MISATVDLRTGPGSTSTKPHELDYWSEALGCTEQQLRAAVAAVGVSSESVREYLR
jgi:hypothetical protein